MRSNEPTISTVIGDGPELDLVRRMFLSYAEEFADSTAESLCFEGFDAQVAGLPGMYAPTLGRQVRASARDRLNSSVTRPRRLASGAGPVRRG